MYADIHAHMLPGLDDGAADMETAVRMALIAYREGIRHMIITPHYISGRMENGCDVVDRGIESLNAELFKREIDLRIYPGNEMFLDMETAKRVEDCRAYSLNSSRYVLVELPLSEVPGYTAEALFGLSVKGYVPVVAHPERNIEIAGSPDILGAFIKNGVLSQVNASSLRGVYGNPVRKTAFKLLKSGMVHFVASDAHTLSGRRPAMNSVFELVGERFGEEFARALFLDNGMAVIEDRQIKAGVFKPPQRPGKGLIGSVLDRIRP